MIKTAERERLEKEIAKLQEELRTVNEKLPSLRLSIAPQSRWWKNIAGAKRISPNNWRS